MSFELVIPTIGRPTLARLLRALAAQPQAAPRPERVILVDDRRDPDGPLPGAQPPGRLGERLTIIPGAGRGPAAARNLGWRAGEAEWVAFLDDDVILPPGWLGALARDLEGLGGEVAASQGRIRVPLPESRRPTDWERNVAGLQRARWATADMAYRRRALQALGGFDERFAHAYREDADIGLRTRALGMEIVQGEREVLHPPGRASFWTSVKLQRGNADDALMRRLHGSGWRERAGEGPGRLRRHATTVAAAPFAGGAALVGRRRSARIAALACVGGIAELAYARIAPGPRDPRELARMTLTSAALPFAAVAHRLRGELRWRAVEPATSAAVRPRRGRPIPRAVLFDRDDTLIRDVPYNGDPARVMPMPGAPQALQALRAAGVPIGVISNQSGVARGLISEEQVRAVNERAQALLGPVDVWLHCPHGPEDGCACRKPRPGLVLRAAELLGVAPEHCAVVGDIGADVGAARAAGARGVLVPTARTRAEELAAAQETAPDLLSAVRMLMGAPA